MGRRRRGRSVSGILLLDKPAGESSNKSLQRAKRLFDAAKAGHTGSLDPLATGVLPVCFGEATKFSSHLLEADKSYDATFALGLSTDSGDCEGAVVCQRDASALTAERIEEALESFRGPIQQLPPMYSAIKKDGQPLYKLARKGIEVPREPRCITIREFRIKGFRGGEVAQLEVSVTCSKGTYIRSLAMDLGERLDVGGHVTMLRRTKAGPFCVSDAVELTFIEGMLGAQGVDQLDSLLLPIDHAMSHLPLVPVPESSGFYLRQGQPVLVRNAPLSGMVRVASETGEFLGLAEVLDDGRIAPRRLVVS
ncbi:MAG: tRNA pseudouridine(55) synthase TruB [Pseudomonadota bacterium]